MKCSKCDKTIKYSYDLSSLKFKYIMDKTRKNPWPKVVKVRMNLIGKCKKCGLTTKLPDFKNYVLEKDNFNN